MTIEAGKTYLGEHQQRLRVERIEGSQVSYVHPISGVGGTMTLAAFRSWARAEATA